MSEHAHRSLKHEDDALPGDMPLNGHPDTEQTAETSDCQDAPRSVRIPIRAHDKMSAAEHAVELLLRSAPMLSAPAGFAEHILAALSSSDPLPRRRLRRRGFRLPWLMLTLLLLFPLSVLLFGQGPGASALGVLLRQVAVWMNMLSIDAAALLNYASGLSAGPSIGLIALLAVGAIGWWSSLQNAVNRRLVVYRIPVRFH